MSSYPPPSENVSIFNSIYFSQGSQGLTFEDGDDRYLKLTGGTERGLVVFNLGIFTNTIFNTGTTLTVPTGITGALVSTTATQTLTNKTLTLPVISSISNSGTLTLPTGAQSLVGTTASQTLTNKTLTAPIISTISNTGTLTLPTSTDTLVGRNTTDTLTNKTLLDPILSQDGITISLPSPSPGDEFVLANQIQSLYNKALFDPGFIVSGLAIGYPGVSLGATFVLSNSTQTLTNKTFQASDGSVGSPSISFTSDTNTGLYRIGGDNIGIACNGIKQMDIGTSLVSVRNSFDVPNTITANSAQIFDKNLKLGTDGTTLTLAAATQGFDNTLNIPALDSISADMVITTNNQTIGGTKTFSNQIRCTATSNQIVLNSTGGFNLTLNALANAANRTYNIPDGANGSFMITSIAQTIGGQKTFTSPLLSASGTAALPGYAFSGATNTGLYLNGSSLGFSTAGTNTMNISSTEIQPQLPITNSFQPVGVWSVVSAQQVIATDTNTGFTAFDTQLISRRVTQSLGVVTVQDAGFYLIMSNVSFQASTGTRQAWFSISGSTARFGFVTCAVASGGIQTRFNLSVSRQLTANSTIQLFVRQDSGVNLNVPSSLGDTDYMQISVLKIF